MLLFCNFIDYVLSTLTYFQGMKKRREGEKMCKCRSKDEISNMCSKCYVESIIKDLITLKALESSIDQRLNDYLEKAYEN